MFCTVATHVPPPMVSVSEPVALAMTVTRLLAHDATATDAAPMATVMSPPDDAERVTSIWYVLPDVTGMEHDAVPPAGILRLVPSHVAPPASVQPASPKPPAGVRSAPNVAAGIAATMTGAVIVLAPVMVWVLARSTMPAAAAVDHLSPVPDALSATGMAPLAPTGRRV